MTFDIDARMKQWDAANKVQHNGETERILKSDTEKFQRIAPLPEGRDAASRAALFALIHDFMASNGISWDDLYEFKDFVEPVMTAEKGVWLPGNDRYTNEMGALSAARDMEQQKMYNMMDQIRETRRRAGVHDEDAMMNNTGIDRPRAKSPYVSTNGNSNDLTDHAVSDTAGVHTAETPRTKAEKGKEKAADSEGDFEGE